MKSTPHWRKPILVEHRCDTAADNSIGVILCEDVTSLLIVHILTIGMLTWSLPVITYVLHLLTLDLITIGMLTWSLSVITYMLGGMSFMMFSGCDADECSVRTHT